MAELLARIWEPTWVKAIVWANVITVWCLANFYVSLYLERKVSAWMQNRLGPMRQGPQGTLQILADLFKLLQKEDIIPRNVDKWLFLLSPYIAFIPAVLIWLVVPFGPGLVVADYNIGIIIIAAVTSYAVIAIFMSGWGSNNKYSLLGAMRGAAQMISYEVTLVMSVIGVAMMAGSLQLSTIVEQQINRGALGWYIFPQLIGFVVYLIASLAELNRAPFDLVEAEQELVSGYHTEYSGFRWAGFMLTEYVHMVAWSAIAATLFLGGWAGPTIVDLFRGLAFLGNLGNLAPNALGNAILGFADTISFLEVGGWAYAWGIFWFTFKTYLFIFLALWIRWTFPRVRIDHLMDLGWKFLLPVALFNIFLTGVMRFGWVNFGDRIPWNWVFWLWR